MKETNIESIKEVAILFANLPVEPNEEFPFLVSHPFIQTSSMGIQTKEGVELVNVLEEDGAERARKYFVERIEEIDDYMRLMYLISKPYRFTFLDHICGHLSNDDLGTCLRYVWRNNEYANSGSVFTKKKLVSLFSRSTKSRMMCEEELAAYQGLPERITIYRGVSSVNNKDIKVFSWTLSREKAEWYAGRFRDPVQNIYQAELLKSGVLAYFSSDQEIIANPFKLENILQIE